MTPIQLMLEDIAHRYDQAYADCIQLLTQQKLESYQSNTLDESVMQIVSLYEVMDEEGFSHSERGAVFAAALEKLTSQSLSPQAWEEIQDMPVYGIKSFSPSVSEELQRLTDPPLFL